MNVSFHRWLAGASLWLLAVLVFPAAAQSQAMCGIPGNDGDGNVGGVVNTYYAGSGTLPAGATQLTLGARNTGSAAGNIQAGDLLLVIQMQDGQINSANNANYGSGTGTGSGTTTMENAGRHEFVRASNGGAAGATISFQPALTHAYTQANATTSRGRRSYQVIRVPQYSSVTMAGVVAPPWDGNSGGVVAVDASGTITLGSATVEGIANRAVFLAGRGFRGGAGFQGSQASNDLPWRLVGGTTAATTAHGGKGEGIAGTPRYLARKTNNFGLAVTTTGHLVRVDNGVQGYPLGDRARGAPGNAGGGGTEGTYSPGTAANMRNAGGGGGGNHAPGGLGGRPWDAPLNDTNGRGGAGYASQISFSRVLMGGGGGSGGNNDGTDDAAWHENNGIACGTTTGGGASGSTFGAGICSSGGSGGGIVILRARSIEGTGVIDVRGGHGYNVRNDAAGGGGGGGSVVLYTQEGGQATVDASGGDGGNAWAGSNAGPVERHGPGGGGGGGFVVFSPNSMTINANVDGGQPGRSTNGATDTYGSFGHNGGIATFMAPDTPGVPPGAQCEPDLRLSKDNGIDVLLTSGSTTYTLSVSNTSVVPTAGTITVVDVLPPQLTVANGPVPLAGPQAGDWSCLAASDVLTCTSNTVIPAGGASVFNFTAIVDAPSGTAIINRGRVGGGGDPNKPIPTPGNTGACIDNNVAPGCAIDIDIVEAPFLGLTKANAGPLLAGGTGQYTLTLANLGSAPTSGPIRIVDVLPDGISFDSGFTTTGGFSCSHAAGVVECNSSAVLAVGASATISFTITVDADAPTSVTNRAIAGGGGDPAKPGLPDAGDAQACPAPVAPADNASSALTGCASVTDPVRRVQLTLEKTDHQNSMPVNGQTTYHFTVRNSGDADSVGTIHFRDELPAPMTWSNPLVKGGADGADWTCVREDNNSATCQSTAVIPVGGSSTFSLVANVNNANPNLQYINKGRIGGGGDPDLLPGMPTPGQVSTGCTGINVGPGCALDINVPVAQSQIRLAKSHPDPQAANPGDTITFSLVVSNSGGNASSGQIRVVDVIPPGMTYVGTNSFNSGGFSCTFTATPAPGYLTCNRNMSLAAGASTTITYTAQVAANASNPLVNRAQVGGGGDPGLPGATGITPATAQECSAHMAPHLGCAIDPVPLNADLQIDKSQRPGTSGAFQSGPLTVFHGDTVQFSIVIGNNGPSTVTGATFTDIIPAQFSTLSIVSASGSTSPVCTLGSYGLSGNTLSGTVTTIAPGGSCTLVVEGTASVMGVGIINTATVAAPPGVNDIDPGNNSSSTETDIVAMVPALAITKTSPDTLLIPGGSASYAVTVANTGNIPLSNVVVTDPVPAGLTGFAWTCAASGGATCPAASGTGALNETIASLPVGGQVTWAITAQVESTPPNPVENTATASADETCTTPCPATVTVPTSTAPAVAKQFDPDSIGVGGSSTLTITLTNANAGVATLTADLVDTLPAGVTLTGAPVTTCVGTVAGTAGGPAITLQAGAQIPGGTPGSCTITAPVTGDTPGTFTNTIPAGGLVTDLGSNLLPAEDDLTVTATPPTVAKAFAPDTIDNGGTSTLTITLGNANTVAAVLTADLVDNLPTGVTLASVPTSSCTGTVAGSIGGSTITLASGSTIPAGGCTISADVTSSTPGTFTNTIPAGGLQTDLGDNPDPAEDDLTVLDLPQVSVAKSANPASGSDVLPGQSIQYQVTVTVADAPLSAEFGFQDSLGAGLTFDSLVGAPGFNCTGTLACTLPAGTPVGNYTATYTATVDADASGSVGNQVVITANGGDPDPVCTVCATDHPVPAPVVTVAKSANPADGTEVTAGQTLTYTLTVTVADAATTSDVVLTDVLGAGLTFAGVTSAGDFTADTSSAPTLVFTLPAGATPGPYTVSYQATVDNDATVSVGNAVTALGGGGPGDPDPSCTTCSTEHPISAPEITVAKSANPADGTEVTAGQTLTYTLSVTVADAATTTDVVLTDVLGAGLTFAGVTSAGDFTPDVSGAPTLVFTLPAGTTPGTHTVSYQATVDNDATVSVGNAVTAIGGGGPGDPDPTCTTCSTDHPISAPVVTVAKSANPADGTEVTAGQTLTYTLTVTVADAATTSDVVLTDVLGAGLTFAGVTSAGDFTADTSSAPTLVFTLPAGAMPGIHEVSYTATVDNDATVSVGNAVTALGGGGPGDPDPVCTTCSTDHPISAPEITVAKSANPVDGTEVTAGQTLTYTLTVTVADAATTTDVVLTDVLGAGLTFAGVTSAGDFTPDVSGAPTLVFTLPAGVTPGPYTVSYQATVDNDATVSVGNAVTAIGGGGPGDPDPVCTTCSTDHPISAPEVTVAKSANPADGTEVTAGQTLTYTLTVTVADAATTTDVVLTDVLGAGLSFGSIVSSDFDSDDVSGAPSLVFTLDAGAIPGIYTVVYEATVDNDATVSVGNAVTALGGGGPGDPDPVCTTCSTDHPISAPEITVAKSADPANGTEVTAGQSLTYTLTVTVADAATTTDVVLTDVLGAGLTFAGVTSAGDFTPDVSGAPTLVFTLPAGATPGPYTVSYQATVDNDATVSVGNAVTAIGGGGPGDPDPSCTTCSTEHPISAPEITVAKSANPADGTEVTAGQSLTYTLTVTVADAATTTDVVLTDVLGAGLSFGSIVSSDFDSDDVSGAPSLVFTLDAGAIPGTYTVVYEATVDNDATVSVGNAVTAIGGGGPGDPDPVCTTCSTDHPISAPVVTVAKSANPADGTEVTAGQTLAYTLTVTVADAATTTDVVLTDILGAGLSFGSIVSSDFDSDDVSGAPSLVFTLDAGAIPGTYTVVYEATVDNDATVSVGNAVTAIGGGGPGDPDPTCTTCSTDHPISAPEITVAKSADPADGTEVTAGQTLTYTLSVTVADAATTTDVVLTDILGAGLSFGSIVSSDFDSDDVSGAPTLVFTLDAGAIPGTYTVVYEATVDNDATVSVGNAVTAIGGGGPGDPDPTCTTCSTDHPISAPEITVAKSANPADGTEVTAGQTLTYTLSVTVADAATTTDVVLTDILGAGLSFGSIVSSDFDSDDVSGAPTLVFTLDAGAIPGTYTVVYEATVDTDATVSVGNAVTAIGGGGPGDPDPVCTTCSTEHPITDSAVSFSKSANPADGTAVAAGETLTYTLTVEVENSATLSDVVLTDVLGAGLSFGSIVSSDFDSDDVSGAPSLVFTLDAGAIPGTYTVVYEATVDTDATVSVNNTVTATGGGDPGNPGAPDPVCDGACETEHPITDPAVSFSKSANPADGTAVAAGETLTYTLTVEVENSATLSDVVLTDTLGAGLSFGSIVSSDFDNDDVSGAPSLVFTLDAGAIPGTYTVVYEATVDTDATVSVNNTVTATGGGDPGNPGAPDPVCDGACETEHPITDPAVSFSKVANPADGTAVAAGETLTYTLTVEVENSATLSDVVLTDVLGAGLSFGSIVSSDFDSDDVSGAPSLVFTLDAGAIPGTYTVVYEATVDTDATVSVNNTVTATGGGDPGNPGAPDPVCDGACETEHPLSPAVTISKALTSEGGDLDGVAEPGETLEYTITLANTGGQDAIGFQVTDLLDDHTVFQSASHGGSHDGAAAGGLVDWTVTVPAHDGTDPGTVELTVTVQVVDDIPQDVTAIINLAFETGTTPPVCPPAGPACVVTPTAPDLVVTKTVSAHSIDDDGVAEPGEQLTYTITLVNHGGVAAIDTIVNEIVPEHTSFVGGAPIWTCAPGDPAGTPCDNLIDVPASAGAGSPGQVTLTFIVEVDDPLADDVQAIRNAVVINDGTPPDCELDPGNPACAVTPTINVDLRKAVAAVQATGPASWRVSYDIEVVNLGGSPAQYTLVDTLGYADGVVFTGTGEVSTGGGLLNPALAGGHFTPANGTPVQLSAADVLLPVGAGHVYTVTVPIGVQPGLLVDGQCATGPGHGLYNLATVSGSFDLDASACADVGSDVPLIRLVKTVELGVDHNGNQYGDVGDVLHYQFVITNPGTVPLTAVQLVDPRVSDLQCQRTTANGQPFYVFRGDEVFDDAFEGVPRGGILDPGDSITCVATHTLSQADVDRGRVVNTATAIGSTAAGQAVSSVSTAIYTALR